MALNTAIQLEGLGRERGTGQSRGLVPLLICPLLSSPSLHPCPSVPCGLLGPSFWDSTPSPTACKMFAVEADGDALMSDKGSAQAAVMWKEMVTRTGRLQQAFLRSFTACSHKTCGDAATWKLLAAKRDLGRDLGRICPQLLHPSPCPALRCCQGHICTYLVGISTGTSSLSGQMYLMMMTAVTYHVPMTLRELQEGTQKAHQRPASQP